MNNDTPEARKTLLEIAIDNRKFEIDLLWRRTLIFWGFISVLLIVAWTTHANRVVATGVSFIGLVFSVIWSLANRGSKAWQESWEVKSAHCVEKYCGASQFYKREPENQDNVFFVLRSRGYSLSRLLIAASDFMVFVWVSLLIYLTPFEKIILTKKSLGSVFVYFCIGYIVYVVCACKSRGKVRCSDDALGQSSPQTSSSQACSPNTKS